ncbi:phosphopantetheine-binding protein [Aquicoccus sp. SCR17]|nr:phosphopantetheine-binding protein [Carideicomes alvinocaridis]
MSLTKERMRADIAQAVNMAPAEIGDRDNLYDLGLDSMRLMTLVMEWQENEPDLDNGRIWEGRCLADWWAEVETLHAGA